MQSPRNGDTTTPGRAPVRRGAGALLAGLVCAFLTFGPMPASGRSYPSAPRSTQPALASQPAPVSAAELAAAYAEPAIVVVDVTWVGFLRDGTTGELLDEARTTVTGSCSGVGVSNDGYLATTGDCLDPMSALPPTLRALVDRRVAEGRTPPDQADQLYEDLLDRAVLLGESWSDLPERDVEVRRTVTPDGPLPATVTTVTAPEDGKVALLKIERDNQPMLPLAEELAEDTEVVLVELVDTADQAVRSTSRQATITAVTPRLLASTTSSPEATLPGGIAITNDAAVAGLITDHAGGVVELSQLTAIRDLLLEEQADTEPGQVDTDFRAGVDAYHDGRYTEAIERFDSVLAIIPSHVQAHSYRDLAQQLREAEGGGPPTEKSFVEKVTGWLTDRSTGVVGLGVLAAILVFLLHKRREPAADRDPTDDREQATEEERTGTDGR